MSEVWMIKENAHSAFVRIPRAHAYKLDVA